MSNGVTEFTSKFPAPKRRREWPFTLLLVALFLGFMLSAGALYWYATQEPGKTQTVMVIPSPVVVTRIMPTEPAAPTATARTIVVYQPTVVEVVVTRVVTVNTYFTPTPPTDGKG